MTYVSSLTYILTGMLTTLPYHSFKSYFSNTKLYLLLFINMLFALKLGLAGIMAIQVFRDILFL